MLVLAAAVSKKPYQHAIHAAGQYLSFATRSGLSFSNGVKPLATTAIGSAAGIPGTALAVCASLGLMHRNTGLR